MKTILLTAMLAAAAPTPAQEEVTKAAVPSSADADARVKANPEQIAKLLADEGYRAKVETDKDGAQFIKSASSGRNFTIYLLGCDGGVKIGACDSIEFYTGFTTGKPFPIERTNDWNAKNRYGRAYVDSQKDPVVEMDIFLDAGGMPRAQFVENLDIWTSIMANFDAFVFDDGEDAKKK